MTWTGAFGRACRVLLHAIVRGLALTRISPNILTFIGLVINIGAAVLFGPHVWNFRDTAQRLVESGAARQIVDGGTLEAIVRDLLGSATERERLGAAARAFVASQQGATERTVTMLGEILRERQAYPRAA